MDWTAPGPDSSIARAGTKSTYFDMGARRNEIKETYGLNRDEMFVYFNQPVLDEAIESQKR
jgi:hypothetical protein